MTLSEIIQNQNSRVGALEDTTLDNVIMARIAKIYEDVEISVQVKVTKAGYVLCGQAVCDTTQLNTQMIETRCY